MLATNEPEDPTLYHHGQYKGSGVAGSLRHISLPDGADVKASDHQSPLKPDDYISQRVFPQCRLYQQRLPEYYCTNTTMQLLLVVLALVGSLFSILSISSWTAVVTAVVSGLTSWSEFRGTPAKIMRYSGAVHQITQLTLWWESLTDVDKASMKNVNHLVGTFEGYFIDECRGWLSTAMAKKDKQTEDDTKGRDAPQAEGTLSKQTT